MYIVKLFFHCEDADVIGHEHIICRTHTQLYPHSSVCRPIHNTTCGKLQASYLMCK